MRGASDVLDGLISDLRGHTPLTDRLESSDAVYAGWPADSQGYDAEVALTSIYDGSTPHRGATTRTYRVQVSVTVTNAWRRSHSPDPGSDMAAILDAVADRLDVGAGEREAPLGNERGPQPQPVEGGRVALISDWRLRGVYADE